MEGIARFLYDSNIEAWYVLPYVAGKGLVRVYWVVRLATYTSTQNESCFNIAVV